MTISIHPSTFLSFLRWKDLSTLVSATGLAFQDDLKVSAGCSVACCTQFVKLVLFFSALQKQPSTPRFQTDALLSKGVYIFQHKSFFDSFICCLIY